jgi:hypothetical protein
MYVSKTDIYCEILNFVVIILVELGNMTWLEPATDVASCTQDQGCYEYYPELGIVGYQYPIFSFLKKKFLKFYANACVGN